MNEIKESKDFNDRRNEILDVANKLFITKGYEKCTIVNILEAVGIAKGTFYYYFKSKEEVLDALIDRLSSTAVQRAEEVVSNENYSPLMKLLHVILSMRIESGVDEGFIESLHQSGNSLMHQKSLNTMVTKISPLLTRVVEEGVEQGVFASEYPREYMQIFLTSSIVLLDQGIFQVQPEEQAIVFRALISLLEKMLGVEEDACWSLAMQYWG